jgi:hypothetical protein
MRRCRQQQMDMVRRPRARTIATSRASHPCRIRSRTPSATRPRSILYRYFAIQITWYLRSNAHCIDTPTSLHCCFRAALKALKAHRLKTVDWTWRTELGRGIPQPARQSSSLIGSAARQKSFAGVPKITPSSRTLRTFSRPPR